MTVDGKRLAIRAEEPAAWLKAQHLIGLPLKPENVTGKDWQEKIKGRRGIAFFANYWARDGEKLLGDSMKRFLAAFGAFIGGLLLTWLCVYTLSHASLPSLGWKRAGCDVEHCGPAWIVPASLALIFAPSIGFAVTGWRAVARAWPIRRTVAVFGLLIVGTAAMFTTAYVL